MAIKVYVNEPSYEVIIICGQDEALDIQEAIEELVERKKKVYGTKRLNRVKRIMKQLWENVPVNNPGSFSKKKR